MDAAAQSYFAELASLLESVSDPQGKFWMATFPLAEANWSPRHGGDEKRLLVLREAIPL